MRRQLWWAGPVVLGVALAATAAAPVGRDGGVARATPVTDQPAPTSARGTAQVEAPRRHTDMRIGGHRGGIDEAPENTMAAVRRAVELGADAVEIDVRFSDDGRPLVLHDMTLDRTTDCDGEVARRAWSELTDCDAGSWFEPGFAGERVPALDAALAELSRTDLVVYLHVKLVDTAAQARALVGAVQRHDMGDGQAVFVADRSSWLDRLARAGAPRRYLARVFNSADGWRAEHRRWKIIVPYNVPVTRARVDRAHARGQQVLAVEGHPLSVQDADRLGIDGFLADDLGAAMAWADR